LVRAGRAPPFVKREQSSFAVAVSGGADSLCLAWLSRAWGTPLGLIVDHGLRPESAAEASSVAATLDRMGIFARVLTLKNLERGPGLAARARAARYEALIEATREAGLTHLLLGHHEGDQAETYLIRQARRSRAAGLACMASIRALPDVCLVRPLLGVPPERLREILRREGIAWVEDPSNRDLRTTRAQMRARLADTAESGPILRQAKAFGVARAREEARVAAILGERAAIFPQGFAVLSPGPIDATCLAALIRGVAGADYPVRTDSLERLVSAEKLCGTLGGVRFLPAGKLGPGTLVVREEAGMQAPIAARPGALWDRRFRLETDAEEMPQDMMLGALGDDARRFSRASVPAVVLRTLPALRLAGTICAVPHLGYFKLWTNSKVRLTFIPSTPVAGAPFHVFWAGDAQPDEQHHVPG
jgi:tRNA(Ile)-lysidine synthase